MTSLGYLLCAFLEYLTGALLGFVHITTLPVTPNEFKVALTPLIVITFIGWFFSLRLRLERK